MPRGGAKPGERRGGRRTGTPNRITRELREAIQNAFDLVGGERYLVTVARKNPAVFCKLLGLTLPKNVNLSGVLRTVRELSDAELVDLATGGRSGVTDSAKRPTKSH